MPQTVLLTGITGFIAKRLAFDLLEAGHTVRGSLRSARRADEVRDTLRPHLSDPGALDRLSFVELDLTSDTGWTAAATGVDAIMHTASPFPMAQPKNADEIIRPAIDGTLRALRAATAAGVNRVILTSSIVAIYRNSYGDGQTLSESDWSDPDHPAASPYDSSKTLAEKAAWDYAAAHPEIALTAINPGLVVGTPMDTRYGTSLDLMKRLYEGKDPALPRVGFPIVDLEDVSAMHLAALDKPETAGKRYIACDAWVTMPELARAMVEAVPSAKATRRQAPDWLVRLLAYVDPAVKTVVPALGVNLKLDNSRARSEMGISFVPWREGVKRSAMFLETTG